MMETALPEGGCFTATYPDAAWEETPCTTAPNFPYVPKNPPHPLIVGNGNDLSPQAPAGFISTAVGSFENVTNVTSESGQINGTGSAVANAYSMQLNTNFFSSTACSGAAVPASCLGWEQFIFANDGSSGAVFIQYWLISYNTTCPSGWIPYTYPGPSDTSCYRNSPNSTAVPNQPITNLAQLSLSGIVNASSDSVTLSSGGTLYSATGGNFVNAAAGWTIADFAIVGNAGGGQANFNSGASFVERTRITYGQGDPPTCVAQGFTGETNNLGFGPNKPSASAPGPALLDQQSSSGGVASCTLSTSVGDTHLTTFDGLLYDFQASGDFILAQVEPDFVVQTRQVSGAPTWPDASVNSAVATQMGKTQVAVCLGDRPLRVDGTPTPLEDGDSLSLPDGVAVWRTGSVYVIVDQYGYSVRAEIKTTWMNVSVGLGQWPVEVHGLLANADGNVKQIEARDGTVLETPFSFEELYNPYADSWRVPPEESLLSACGENIELGIPGQPFYVDNLPQELSERARTVCLEKGVEDGPLLDACILDVAVIGDDAAAEFYVGAPAPTEVGVIQ
ncbi:MAG: VWD domain-containing protein [Candidatus Promineifilaceae bacterium]